jgi:hypothetical protein
MEVKAQRHVLTALPPLPSHLTTMLCFHLPSDLGPANLITFDWISLIFIKQY